MFMIQWTFGMVYPCCILRCDLRRIVAWTTQLNCNWATTVVVTVHVFCVSDKAPTCSVIVTQAIGMSEAEMQTQTECCILHSCQML